MKAAAMLTILRHRFTYDREAGRLFWKTATHSGVKIGDEAGSPMNQGRNRYRRISIDGKKYLVHRLVWLIETGDWPTAQCDHINRDPADNRFSNLRDVPNNVNARNSSRNTSGVPGVHYHAQSGTWKATHADTGRARLIGQFPTFGEAVAAVELAKAGVLVGVNSRKNRSSAVGKAIGL